LLGLSTSNLVKSVVVAQKLSSESDYIED